MSVMYSIKNVVERLGNAEHEYGAVRFLMSSIRSNPLCYLTSLDLVAFHRPLNLVHSHPTAWISS